jgi:hypothetical protein
MNIGGVHATEEAGGKCPVQRHGTCPCTERTHCADVFRRIVGSAYAHFAVVAARRRRVGLRAPSGVDEPGPRYPGAECVWHRSTRSIGCCRMRRLRDVASHDAASHPVIFRTAKRGIPLGAVLSILRIGWPDRSSDVHRLCLRGTG